ncbi:MAG: NrtA/SsuA/CpmA family ABC transporter substrate-binding protein [Proteobacteria bacterium]|nr:NrtA/SsuA/CpmA family ABC transporter substrate-binding protein [Pseudomonadota bacterium]
MGLFTAASFFPLELGVRSAAADDLPVVNLGTQPYPGEGNLFVAAAKGFFEKAGVKVAEKKLPSGRLTMDAMMSGSLDIATPVETGPMFAIANGTNLAILAQISTNPDEVKPLVRADAGVKSSKDLAGKRLGYGAGSSNQFAMYNWLKAGGVPASAVTLVNLQPADLVTALVNGTIDVGFTWEPFLTAAVQKGAGKVLVVEGQHLYQSRLLLVARPDWAKSHVDVAAKFLQALVMADSWMKANRPEAVKITAEGSSMAQKDLDPIFDRWSFEVELSNALVKAFDDQFAWASEAKLLHAGVAKPDFRKSFYPAALEKARPAGVTYNK